MILFITGIVLTIIAFILLGFDLDENWEFRPRMLFSLILLAIFTFFSCMRSVPTGNTGIVTTFGAVQPYTYEAGVHFTAPWNKVIKMDNRTQKQSIEMACFSSDIQEVTLIYTINYQINKGNAQEIYKTIGTDYYNVIIYPKTQEAVKSVFAQYNAENLVKNRGNLSNQIEEILRVSLAEYNIELSGTSLENIDFTDTFTNAVENKVKAEQDKLTAEANAKKEIVEANAEAEKQRISAQAKADADLIAAQNDVEVQKLAADASEYAGEKTAAINNRIAQSLTPELNQYYLIEAWDGKLPTTALGNNDITTMIDINN